MRHVKNVHTWDVRCIVCASLMRHIFNRGEFSYYRCSSCRMVTTLPHPTFPQIQEHYKGGFEKGNYNVASRRYEDTYRYAVSNFVDAIESHLLRYNQSFDGLKVTIVGDILHSRVARSNIWGLSKLGAEVTVCGPPTMIPVEVEKMGVKVTYDLTEAIAGADVVNLLRVQFERESGMLFPSVREYAAMFSMDDTMERFMKKDALIMHPGPINRGVEISSSMADGKRSVILEQVTNGLAVRMAVLYLISGEKNNSEEA